MKLYRAFIASVAVFSGCAAQPVLAYPISPEFCQVAAQATYTTMKVRGQWSTIEDAIEAAKEALRYIDLRDVEFHAVLNAVRMGYRAPTDADAQFVAQFQYDTCVLDTV